jgi:hypothetical protein
VVSMAGESALRTRTKGSDKIASDALEIQMISMFRLFSGD